MHSWFLAALMVLLLAAPAGAVITEQEPANDAVATAPFVIVKFGSFTTSGGQLGLTAGDIDFLGIPALAVGDIVTMSTTPLDNSNFEDPDTVLGLFDSTIAPNTVILCRNDDAFNRAGDFPPGLGSLCRFQITTPGDYYVGVTGYRPKLPAGCDPAAPPGHADECSSSPFDGGIGAVPCEEGGGESLTCGNYQLTIAVNSLPEPGVILQLVSGGIGLAWLNRRRIRRMPRSSQ